MLLTLDIGNSNIKLALFEKEKQISFARFETKQDNYKSLIMSFIFKAGLRADDIKGVMVASVVPEVYAQIKEGLVSIIDSNKIHEIKGTNDYGITLGDENAEVVGADLIALCAYAYSKYHRDIIAISFGTCSVLCHVTKDGVFKHCIIAPGFYKLAEAIFGSAAQLEAFNLEKLDHFAGINTKEALNIGIYDGYLGMIEHLLQGMISELEGKPYVVASGGAGKLIVPYLSSIDEYEPDMITNALNHLYRRLKND
ncbi:MAG: type III pantothenate kinase [Erysipelotrichaceae bacterium]|nr:type III pantothenate kinase [Erysipelotrichaceae bacterium]